MLAGGVRHPTDRLADAMMAELPGAVALPRPPPMMGALLLATRHASASTATPRSRPGHCQRVTEGAPSGHRLERVSKVFPGDVTAVDDVDLEIADGEFMVLVGPSGCGKSTLLRMIAGLENATYGTHPASATAT